MNLRHALVLLAAGLFSTGLLLSGCTASQQRGVTDNAYLSSTRPALKASVNGMTVAAYRAGSGRLANVSILGGMKVDTWAAYFVDTQKGTAAAIVQAELPDAWQWTTVYPPAQALDVRTRMVEGRTWTSWTSPVVASKDPFMGLAGESLGGNETVFWMQRTMACIHAETQSKIILLYREPLSKELRDMNLFPDMDAKDLLAFRERAQAAFVLEAPDTASLSAASGRTGVGQADGIRWRFVDDALLGPVMERNIGN